MNTQLIIAASLILIGAASISERSEQVSIDTPFEDLPVEVQSGCVDALTNHMRAMWHANGDSDHRVDFSNQAPFATIKQDDRVLEYTCRMHEMPTNIVTRVRFKADGTRVD